MSSYSSNSFLSLIFNYASVGYNIVAGVFLVPFYLSKIPLDVYGSFLTASSLAGLIGLMELGLSMVLTQCLSRSYAQTDWEKFRENLHSGLLAASLLFVLTCLIAAIVSDSIGTLTKISHTYRADLHAAFLLLGISAAGSIYLNMFGAIFQALLKAGTLGIINLLSATIGIITIILAFHWSGTLTAIAAGAFSRVLCANTLLMIQAWRTLNNRKLLPRSAPFAEIKSLLRACVPIFIGSSSKSIVENAQNLLLANLVSPEAVAIFTLTQKVMQVCNMILAPIGSSIYSALTHLREKIERGSLATLMAISIRSHFLLSVILIGTAMALNEQFVFLWVGAEKFGGQLLTYLLGLSTLLLTRFAFIGFIIYSSGDFKKPLALEIGYSCVKIALLFLLVSKIGIFALPIADIVGGLIFLYGFGNRMIAEFISESKFRKGFFSIGWIEFAAIGIFGHAIIASFLPKNSWPMFLLGAILLTLAATIGTMLFNYSFIKNVKTLMCKTTCER